MVGRNNIQNRIIDQSIIAVLVIVTLVCLIPLLHTVAVSFSDKSAADAGRVLLTPIKPTVASYTKVLDDSQFFTSFYISIKRVLLGGLLNFVITVMMAYALSKDSKQFPLRNVYMWFLVFTMMFSGGIVPWFMTVKSYGLLDSMWALVLPHAVQTFNVILLMNFFRNLPKELSEAAEIDGAGPWYTMVRLYVPLSLPAIATVTLFSIVFHWNSFFDGLILMNHQEHYPLQTYIQTLVAQLSAQAMTAMTPEQLAEAMAVSNRTFGAAKIIVSMIPILIIYPFLQRFFIHGITLGSVKE
ncbi:putative ABC transporter permease protein YtcP [Paenibacillus sp. CCS19]|uniref:carbohydrate ABC transporter permease n=1 Tax=Paenibacillus sp. CCS19 TaxID=3158387 RepID=UPI0025649A6F|nr:carbohydrate ABC transporter permease [Paenibacillus cellulosilyticus]GMK41898.1 putative ABC transporter permease protein YtcP [Paenibacillus cellulosilyticus]